MNNHNPHPFKKWWSSNKKFFYVIFIDPQEPDGQKKKFLGPYSQPQAESIMLDYLGGGYCAWVEKDYVKNGFRRGDWCQIKDR